ncbi:hypothetical protein M0R45_026722 [Rubus argutus]|uniref:PB1-like domain-containing protein n=1 Tax=Rubus argutus TaxID=59490 RepID=A0AAW1WZP0_RUBAR
MEGQPYRWRYFQVDGDFPTYNGMPFILITIRGPVVLLWRGSSSRHYRGGEEVWIDEVDPDTISWICLNCMAEDLGYKEPPMTYWFKIPGSTNGEEFLPIRDDKEVNEMLAFIQTSKVLQLYIVGGRVRKKKEAELEDQRGNNLEPIYHAKYIGNVIADIEEDVQSENDGHVNIQVVNDASHKSAVSTYDTRFKGEFSYDPEEFHYEDEDSSDSDYELSYLQMVDSDYELYDEDDDVLFRANVEGGGENIGEWDEMSFAGNISNGEGEDSEKFDSGKSSSSSSEDDVNLDAQGKKREEKEVYQIQGVQQGDGFEETSV